MKAAVIAASRRLEVVDTAPPSPAASQVRVRVEGCGVCASSLPVWEGREWFQYPLAAGAPGHEGWGVVDAVGSGVD
jgi:D-arabinose 1-dehydrogenase-like Zn-dependent alcohol dehydrogenase